MIDIEQRRQAIAKRIELLKVSEKEEQDYPSIFRMARNLAGSLAEVASSAFEGGDIVVEEEEFLDRLEICCDCALLDPSQIRCTHESCGCFLKVKGRLAAMCCPLYLWPGDIEKSMLGLEVYDGQEETDPEESQRSEDGEEDEGLPEE
jgi:hypothetical protein